MTRTNIDMSSRKKAWDIVLMKGQKIPLKREILCLLMEARARETGQFMRFRSITLTLIKSLFSPCWLHSLSEMNQTLQSIQVNISSRSHIDSSKNCCSHSCWCTYIASSSIDCGPSSTSTCSWFWVFKHIKNQWVADNFLRRRFYPRWAKLVDTTL